MDTSRSSSGGNLSYLQLTGLTLEAVLQAFIICVCGYLAARSKLLDKSAQKQLSALNVQLLTPCLIFTKLASSLSLKALVDIIIIPIYFIISTGVCLLCSKIVSRILKLKKSESNFVTAMAVFGNSNSMPVSIIMALAYTLPDLKWPDIPNDNQDDVASRGILYLLVFQQLGQVLRWSWGYNSLLAKPTPIYDEPSQYFDEDEDEEEEEEELDNGKWKRHDDEEHQRTNSKVGSRLEINELSRISGSESSSSNSSRTSLRQAEGTEGTEDTMASSSFSIKKVDNDKSKLFKFIKVGYTKFMSAMNPPLWSMAISIFIASIPALQYEFFHSDGFVQHTITTSIRQLGNCAIPLILVVLGSNLAPDNSSAPASPHYGKIVFASLISRMILPSVLLLPLIAMAVKYINISILDDPVFLLVAFILTVSPPAIQLSQICQLNQVFEKEMAGVLFWGYVILTLPSAIIIVVASLEVLEWAGITHH